MASRNRSVLMEAIRSLQGSALHTALLLPTAQLSADAALWAAMPPEHKVSTTAPALSIATTIKCTSIKTTGQRPLPKYLTMSALTGRHWSPLKGPARRSSCLQWTLHSFRNWLKQVRACLPLLRPIYSTFSFRKFVS